MSKVTGTVGWVGKNKFGKYSLKLEESSIWYNSNYEIKANKGDRVEFDDGGKQYCQKLKVVGSTATGLGSPAKGTDNSFKERSIIRQNALRHASVIISNCVGKNTDEELTDRVLAMAKRFEAYASGDLDKEEEGFNPEQFTGDGDFVE